MFPYWVLFSIFAVGSMQATRHRRWMAPTSPLLAAAGIFIALIIGLRYEVGADWANYEEIFRTISYVDDLGTAATVADPGYAALNWMAARMGAGMWFVNLACGGIFTWGLLRFARRQPNPWLAMAIAVPYLVIVVAMGYSRQGVAIGIVLAAFAVLDRASPLRIVAYIVAAAAFHKSALVVLPLVALSLGRQNIMVAAVLGVVAALLYYQFVDASADAFMSTYVEARYSSQGAWVRVGMSLVPAVIFLATAKRFGLSPKEESLWRFMSYAAILCLLLLMFTPSSTAVDRMALYLIPLQIFVLSRLPEIFAGKGGGKAQVMLLVIAYSALIQFVWLNFAVHASSWIPYRVYPLLPE